MKLQCCRIALQKKILNARGKFVYYKLVLFFKIASAIPSVELSNSLKKILFDFWTFCFLYCFTFYLKYFLFRKSTPGCRMGTNLPPHKKNVPK